MSCSGSTYCFTNTGNNLINDTYISGGTHNSNLYYTGVTNNLFIYYSTTNNEWCLSTALNGSCLMSGDSPGPSQGCPDFSNFYFSEGLCPTPTPTPTPKVEKPVVAQVEEVVEEEANLDSQLDALLG